MPILVTAFAPFGGRKENASALVLHELIRRKTAMRYRILPVDAVLAPARLRQALLHLRPEALIMLGEAGGSHEIRLETKAWNEKDFKIPDSSGRQPRGAPVRLGEPPFMASTLPTLRLQALLKKAAQPVSLSQDPGRYLCNQLFYEALYFIKKHKLPIPAGFIHLPLEMDLPTARAAEAMARVIAACQPHPRSL